MERPPRDFKGIWIPKEVWLSEELSLMEKVLFVEIHSLDNERGCFASNKYFGDFFVSSRCRSSPCVEPVSRAGVGPHHCNKQTSAAAVAAVPSTR